MAPERTITDRSIRKLLLAWLLVPLAAVLVASGVAAYHTALRFASDAYDRSLLDPAFAIAQRLSGSGGRVQIDLPTAALEVLRVDTADRVYFAVNAGERLIAGQQGLPTPPEQPAEGVPVFYDGAVNEEPVRVAAMTVPFAGEEVLIQVAETTVKRDRLVRQLLFATAAPEVAFFIAAFAVVWFGVARGLAPLHELRAELAARSHRDLRPVPERHAPLEVRPLVHELNDLLHRLAESIGVQQRFVADAAHQLRTPLAALQAQVEAARRERLPPELAPTVDHLYAATRRAAHLARQLLTLAAVDPASERQFVPEASDLARIAQGRVDDWLATADVKHIDLGFELEPAPVLGEPHLLAELATNLVDNALRYTLSDGEVTVRTGRRDARSFLEVEDNGPGIPESERERVFERFYRLRSTPGEGTGLGLAIVREIALRHDAVVEIRVPASRIGTVVAVTFPMAAGTE